MSRQEDMALMRSFLDNTAGVENLQELGIFKFAKALFPEEFSNDFAEVHYSIMQDLYIELLSPARKSRIERQGYAIVHREAAKTTLISFLIPLYNILLKGLKGTFRLNDGTVFERTIGEDFILIVSETASAAEEFVNNIRAVLDERSDLKHFFGEKRPIFIKSDTVSTSKNSTWRKNCFITKDKTIVRGVGTGQQVRGKNIRNKRPTLCLCDDLYSEKNTISEYGRGKVDAWFFKALCNSIDKVKGKMVVLGTMVHEEIIFKSMKKSDLWFGISRPIIALEELDGVLKKHCKVEENDMTLPNARVLTELNVSLKTLSWRERHDIKFILSLYKSSLQKRDLGYFYSEYLNIARSPDKVRFKEEWFKEINLTTTRKKGQLIGSFKLDGCLYECILHLYTGTDIASSLRAKADDTAVALGGWAFAQHNVPGEGTLKNTVFPILVEVDGGKWDSLPNEERPSVLEKLALWKQMYGTVRGRFETAGQQASIYRSICQFSLKHGLGLQLIGAAPPPDVSKEVRVNSVFESVKGLSPSAFLVVPSRKSALFMSQLQYLGSSAHDDYADAAAQCFQTALDAYPALPHVFPRSEHVSPHHQEDMSLTEILLREKGAGAWMYL